MHQNSHQCNHHVKRVHYNVLNEDGKGTRMYKLKYAGPKALISKSGVSLDRKKEDKYSYLPFAVTLLEALDHDYGEQGQTFSYESKHRHTDGDTLLEKVRDYCPDIDDTVRKWVAKKEAEIANDIERARRSQACSEIERETYIRNLKLMHDYRLQRTINKSVYYAVLDALAAMIIHKRIRFLKAPFSRIHHHVFHSIEGAIRRQKSPLRTLLSVYREKEALTVLLEFTGG